MYKPIVFYRIFLQIAQTVEFHDQSTGIRSPEHPVTLRGHWGHDVTCAWTSDAPTAPVEAVAVACSTPSPRRGGAKCSGSLREQIRERKYVKIYGRNSFLLPRVFLLHGVVEVEQVTPAASGSRVSGA